MHNFTTAEKAEILAAVLATTPSGGGSAIFTLARKLGEEFGVTPSDEQVAAAAGRVFEEAHTLLLESGQPEAEDLKKAMGALSI